MTEGDPIVVQRRLLPPPSAVLAAHPHAHLRVKHHCLLGDEAILNLRIDRYRPGDRPWLSRVNGCTAEIYVGARGDWQRIADARVDGVAADHVRFRGLEDPRVIRLGERRLCVANAALGPGRRAMCLIDCDDRQVVPLRVDCPEFDTRPAQKNWAPFVKDGKLFFVYSLDPFVVVEVRDFKRGDCVLVRGTPAQLAEEPRRIFGSTPFVPWSHPFYVGFTHTRRPHRAVLTVIDAETMQLVGHGRAIDFAPPDGVRPWRGESVQFPYDLRIDGTEIELGVEFEDRCSAYLTLEPDAFSRAVSTIAQQRRQASVAMPLRRAALCVERAAWSIKAALRRLYDAHGRGLSRAATK